MREEKQRKSNKIPVPFKRCALCDLLTLPRLSVSPTSTDSIIVTLTFSLTVSHTQTHTHPVVRTLLRRRQLVSQCVRLAPETGVIRSYTHTHTHTVWIAVGNIWDGFPRNVLACLRNVSLLSSPLSSSFSLSFLPYRQGLG